MVRDAREWREDTNRIDSITIGIGMGLPEWGAPTYREVFIIKHHREPSPFVVGKNFKR